VNVTTPTLPHQLLTGDGASLVVTYAYVNGSSYDVSIVTSSGYKYTDHFTGGQDKT